MNWFEVLLWLVRTFHIETFEGLMIAVFAVDLAVHFVVSALAGYFLYSLTQFAFYLLYSMVGFRPGRTTWEGKLIYLCSLGSLVFASWFVHCVQDYGWHGFWMQLNGGW